MLVGELRIDGDHAAVAQHHPFGEGADAAVGVHGLAARAPGHDARREDAAEHLRALVGLIADAPEALAALRRAGDHDAVAGAHALDVRPHLFDDARRRVAEDRRRRRGHVPARAERVGDADVDGRDAHDDLVRLGRAQLDLLDHERAPDLLQDCSAHRHTI